MAEWIRDQWPWLVAGMFLVVYELTVVALRLIPQAPRVPTLSQLATRAQRQWRPLPYVALTVVAVLFPHFWVPGAAGWVIAAVATGAIWIVWWRRTRVRPGD